MENLPFRELSFDTVVCFHTLEHTMSLERAVSELKRVALKRLLIIVPKAGTDHDTPYHTQEFHTEHDVSSAIGIAQNRCIKKKHSPGMEIFLYVGYLDA